AIPRVDRLLLNRVRGGGQVRLRQFIAQTTLCGCIFIVIFVGAAHGALADDLPRRVLPVRWSDLPGGADFNAPAAPLPPPSAPAPEILPPDTSRSEVTGPVMAPLTPSSSGPPYTFHPANHDTSGATLIADVGVDWYR